MGLNSNQIFIGSSVALAAAVSFAIFLYSRRKQKQWRKVAEVAKIYMYPIKSSRGLELDVANVSLLGIGIPGFEHAGDRCFLVVSPNGQMVTARQEPRLVLIVSRVSPKSITLSAPEMDSICVPIPTDVSIAMNCRVWGEDIAGVDCGNDVAKWLQTFLNTDYRLVYYPRNSKPRDICGRDVEIHRASLEFGKAVYHDCAPFNILSQASVEDVDDRTTIPVTVRNFRPSILVTGCSAYNEDKWTHVKIGNVEMKLVKFCSRCLLTTVNPDTGIKDSDREPLKTMETYRQCDMSLRHIYGTKPLLGTHMGILKPGQIKVGDSVYAL